MGMSRGVDADNDGDLDLLITGRSYDLGDEDIRLYRNTSDGFSDVSAELPTLPTGDVHGAIMTPTVTLTCC